MTSISDPVTTEAHLPHNNPCGQCAKPIGTPIWWERTERFVAYVWKCEACDYEFTSIAFYSQAEDERRLAA